MKKIGITGNIGSGKSTLTKVFSLMGIPVYDADSRAKWLMQNQPEIQRGLIAIFGEEVYDHNQILNRVYLANLVFQQPNLLAQLNALVHPLVFADFDHWLAIQNAPYIVKEAALLIESESYKQLDELILVCAPEHIRIQRTMERDGTSREAVEARMKNQMEESLKIPFAKYIVQNDGTQLLIPQIMRIHEMLVG